MERLRAYQYVRDATVDPSSTRDSEGARTFAEVRLRSANDQSKPEVSNSPKGTRGAPATRASFSRSLSRRVRRPRAGRVAHRRLLGSSWSRIRFNLGRRRGSTNGCHRSSSRVLSGPDTPAHCLPDFLASPPPGTSNPRCPRKAPEPSTSSEWPSPSNSIQQDTSTGATAEARATARVVLRTDSDPRAAHEAIPGSRLEVFPDSGHFPHRDRPRRFVEVLVDFMHSTAPARMNATSWRASLRAGGGSPTGVVPPKPRWCDGEP